MIRTILNLFGFLALNTPMRNIVKSTRGESHHAQLQYVFSFLIGESFKTGILYITLMITLAIAGIPNALLSAALPIGTRRNTNPFTESFRIGLALATLAIVTVMSAPETILKIINPELVGGANALKTLLLSITPLTALTTAIMKLNRERKPGKIALIGLARLATLITLLPILSKTLGVNGATIAYLASSAILTPMAVKINPEILKPLTTLWALHTLTALITLIPIYNEAAIAILSLTLTITVMHTTKTLTLQELMKTLKTITLTIIAK